MSSKLMDMTEAQWLQRLNRIGITNKRFKKNWKRMKKKWGFEPPVRDVVWGTLNERLSEVGEGEEYQAIEYEMAFLLAIEGKDIRSGYRDEFYTWEIFLGHEELSHLRKLRADGELDIVETITLAALPTPAALDELRKTLGMKAKNARNEGNWPEVINQLEKYQEFAAANKERCIELVNQEPPKLTSSDLKLLQLAKGNIKTE